MKRIVAAILMFAIIIASASMDVYASGNDQSLLLEAEKEREAKIDELFAARNRLILNSNETANLCSGENTTAFYSNNDEVCSIGTLLIEGYDGMSVSYTPKFAEEPMDLLKY